MEEAPPSGWIPIAGAPRRIASESEIVSVSLALAADLGDPAPRRIQHATCTRAEANRVMCGAVVPGERTSWLIAIQGRFVTPQHGRPFLPGAPAERRNEERMYSVITLVVDVETGAPTDSGISDEYPDLAAAGRVVTDYSAEDELIG